MKRIMSIMLSGVLLLSFSGCSLRGTEKEFDKSKEVNTISREDGSGSRSAFVELLGILEKTADTSKDRTTVETLVANKTGLVLTTVASDAYAVGYISHGSVNETVKAIAIDGVNPTSENIKNGAYPISRPFTIAMKGEPTGTTKDFVDFILSSEGQEIVASVYIPVSDDAPPYIATQPPGKVVVAGSSSVTPIMEKLREGYLRVNPNATVEVQMSDSTSGMKGTLDGICDIGMASRELKDSEKKLLQDIPIAIDGICVIVNRKNPIQSLTKEQVKAVYTREVKQWNELE